MEQKITNTTYDNEIMMEQKITNTTYDNEIMMEQKITNTTYIRYFSTLIIVFFITIDTK
jgi:hypothetical protein